LNIHKDRRIHDLFGELNEFIVGVGLHLDETVNEYSIDLLVENLPLSVGVVDDVGGVLLADSEVYHADGTPLVGRALRAGWRVDQQISCDDLYGVVGVEGVDLFESDDVDALLALDGQEGYGWIGVGLEDELGLKSVDLFAVGELGEAHHRSDGSTP
jgi:hypothetical protein